MCLKSSFAKIACEEKLIPQACSQSWKSCLLASVDLPFILSQLRKIWASDTKWRSANFWCFAISGKGAASSSRSGSAVIWKTFAHCWQKRLPESPLVAQANLAACPSMMKKPKSKNNLFPREACPSGSCNSRPRWVTLPNSELKTLPSKAASTADKWPSRLATTSLLTSPTVIHAASFCKAVWNCLIETYIHQSFRAG